jgi:hypothetical protein
MLVAVAYVEARLSVVLPSTAIGGPREARFAWSLSRGAGVALISVNALASMAAWLILLPISFLLEAFVSSSAAVPYLPLPLAEAKTLIIEAVGVTALSLAFKRLREARPA